MLREVFSHDRYGSESGREDSSGKVLSIFYATALILDSPLVLGDFMYEIYQNILLLSSLKYFEGK